MIEQERLPGFRRLRVRELPKPVIQSCGARHPTMFKVTCQRPLNHLRGPHCTYKRRGLADIEHAWS